MPALSSYYYVLDALIQVDSITRSGDDGHDTYSMIPTRTITVGVEVLIAEPPSLCSHALAQATQISIPAYFWKKGRDFEGNSSNKLS